jgi:endonuclease-8
MSHGHTTHRAARDHARVLRDQPLMVSSPQGRFHHEALLGDAAHVTLTSVEAYGEHLFYGFARGQTVHVSLGATGSFVQLSSPPPAPHDTTHLRLVGDTATLDVLAPATCALISAKDKLAILARLGPDPLRLDASPERFFAYAARSRHAVGTALRDQKVIAGVCELRGATVLHALGIQASTPLRAVSRELIEQLWHKLADSAAAA